MLGAVDRPTNRAAALNINHIIVILDDGFRFAPDLRPAGLGPSSGCGRMPIDLDIDTARARRTEEQTRQRTGDADHQSPPQRTAETINMKAADQPTDKEEQQGVDHPNPDPKSQNYKGQREQHQHRLKKHITRTEQEHRHHQRFAAVIVNAGRGIGRDHDTGRDEEPIFEKLLKIHVQLVALTTLRFRRIDRTIHRRHIAEGIMIQPLTFGPLHV